MTSSYLRPGVFVTESLTPLSAALVAPGNATSAFVGTTPSGPTGPVLVNSWQQFVSTYGGFGSGAYALPFAVYQFFANGGRSAYISRATASDAVAASLTLNDREATAAPLLTITSKAPGVLPSLNVTVTDTGETGRFNFIVTNATSGATETFLDTSMNPSDSRYLVSIVNSPTVGSQYVTVANVTTVTPYTTSLTPVATTNGALLNGADGVTTPVIQTAVTNLQTVDGTLVVNIPGVTDSTTINAAVTWCETVGSAFLVVDAPAAAGATLDAYVSSLTAYATSITASSYRAIYAGNLFVQDPLAATPGAIRDLSPGGAVVGVISATDATKGVQKAPAGITTGLAGVLGMEVTWRPSDLDTLNQAGVNVIKQIPGNGFCVFGARTGAIGLPDRYVNVRRTLIYIEKALTDGTQWAVFEDNDSDLWGLIQNNVANFLNGLWQTGVLKGDTADAAYYVQCDDTNNTPATVSAGQVNVTVGVALNGPAEFLVINVQQYAGGTNTTSAS